MHDTTNGLPFLQLPATSSRYYRAARSYRNIRRCEDLARDLARRGFFAFSAGGYGGST